MLPTDLAPFAEPISANSPAGEYLRYDPVYDSIQEARKEDDASLEQGIWQTALKRADWGTAEYLCSDALLTRSKDLQIAAWLTEAWLAQHGFAGLRAGLQLIELLCETFWDTLYPLPDDGDFDFRLAPLAWMNDKLALRVKSVRITAPATDDAVPYSLIDLESARRVENLARKDPNVIVQTERENGVTMSRFNNSVTLTADAFFQSLLTDIEECIQVLTRVRAFIDERCGDDSPTYRVLLEVLTAARNHARGALAARGMTDNTPNGMEMEEPTETTAAMDEGPATTGMLRSRSDAYRQLSAIADYLQKIEPHSPTPYLIRRAVTWGSMPLTDLLQELMEGNGNVSEIFRLLGIRDLEG